MWSCRFFVSNWSERKEAAMARIVNQRSYIWIYATETFVVVKTKLIFNQKQRNR